MISSIPFSPIHHLCFQFSKFKTTDKHSKAHCFCLKKYPVFLVQISSTFLKILQSKFFILTRKLMNFHVPKWSRPSSTRYFDICYYTFRAYTYSKLYSPTNPHNKIRVVNMTQKTPTCFGTEVPSSEIHYNKSTQTNMPIYVPRLLISFIHSYKKELNLCCHNGMYTFFIMTP